MNNGTEASFDAEGSSPSFPGKRHSSSRVDSIRASGPQPIVGTLVSSPVMSGVSPALWQCFSTYVLLMLKYVPTLQYIFLSLSFQF